VIVFAYLRKTFLSFFQVGDYQSGIHTINRTKIRDYSNGVELMWPNMHRAICPMGRDCRDCYDMDRLQEGFIIDHGDVYVIGTNPVFNTDEGTGCADIFTTNTYQVCKKFKCFILSYFKQLTNIVYRPITYLIHLNNISFKFNTIKCGTTSIRPTLVSPSS